MHDWDFADAWILAAIGVYQRPCTLGELVDAAAWVNDTLPLEVELESALGKLAGAGLVRVYEQWTFELTDEGAGVWSGAARDLRGQLPLIEAQLTAFEPGRASVRLPAGELRRAVEEHRAER